MRKRRVWGGCAETTSKIATRDTRAVPRPELARPFCRMPLQAEEACIRDGWTSSRRMPCCSSKDARWEPWP
eukprot:6112179-Prymnesium_polylepis.1